MTNDKPLVTVVPKNCESNICSGSACEDRGREAGLCIIIINTLGQSHISPSHTILAGQNPAYGTRAEAIQVSVPTAPAARAAKAEHTASMSLQERDFSNPMYCKDIETEDHYTPLPNSEDFYMLLLVKLMKTSTLSRALHLSTFTRECLSASGRTHLLLGQMMVT